MITQATLYNILIMATWSGLATIAGITLMAVLTGKPLYAPLQAISHIAFGEKAYKDERRNLVYMVVGFALNAFAMIMWSAIAELAIRAFGMPPRNVPVAFIVGAVVTIVAYIVDFHVVPKRFTPGFEHILSKRSLYAVYVILAISIYFGAMGRVA